MKRYFANFVLLAGFFLVNCQAEAESEPTLIPLGTWQSTESVVSEISATNASTLTLTPTAIPTVTKTLSSDQLTQTVVVLTAPKEDGVYLVGVEIMRGTWRATGNGGQSCYWVRRKYDGIVFENYYGSAETSITIQDMDFEVEFQNCGTWVYIGE